MSSTPHNHKHDNQGHESKNRAPHAPLRLPTPRPEGSHTAGGQTGDLAEGETGDPAAGVLSQPPHLHTLAEPLAGLVGRTAAVAGLVEGRAAAAAAAAAGLVERRAAAVAGLVPQMSQELVPRPQLCFSQAHAERRTPATTARIHRSSTFIHSSGG